MDSSVIRKAPPCRRLRNKTRVEQVGICLRRSCSLLPPWREACNPVRRARIPYSDVLDYIKSGLVAQGRILFSLLSLV